MAFANEDQYLLDLADRQGMHFKGIPISLFKADHHVLSYWLAYKRGIFFKLRGDGEEAIIPSRKDIGQGSGMTATYLKDQQLSLGLYSTFKSGVDSRDIPETQAQYVTAIRAEEYNKTVIRRHITMEKILRYYGDFHPSARLKLLDWMKRLMDYQLAYAPIKPYKVKTNGSMPVAARTVVGLTGGKYKYSSNNNFIGQLKKCWNNEINSVKVSRQAGMSVEHIEELKRQATASTYGADDLNPASEYEGHLVSHSKFILLMDSDAAHNLRADPDYNDKLLKSGFNLGEGQPSTIRESDFLGTIYDVDCYRVPLLDKIKTIEHCRNGMPECISWSYLMGAGAIGETLGNTSFFLKQDGQSHTELTSIQFIHGCESLYFPVKSMPNYVENSEEGSQISSLSQEVTVIDNNGQPKTVRVPLASEQGIIHSITCNRICQDWETAKLSN